MFRILDSKMPGSGKKKFLAHPNVHTRYPIPSSLLVLQQYCILEIFKFIIVNVIMLC